MKRLFNNLLHRGYLPLLAVFLCLIGGTDQAWALSGATWLRVQSGNSAKGLVYASTSSTTPTDDKYTGDSQSSNKDNTAEGGSSSSNNQLTFYAWAKPARGYKFKEWTKFQGITGSSQTTVLSRDNGGNADVFKVTSPRNQQIGGSATASFVEDDVYTVEYEAAPGGTYEVQYTYYKVGSDNKFSKQEPKLTVTPTSGLVKPDDGGDKNTYGKDVIILSTTAENWTGWYENGVRIETDDKTNYKYIPTQNATVKAEFKSCTLNVPAEAEQENGECYIKMSTRDLDAHSDNIVIPVSGVYGTWQASDFNVTFTHKDGENAISKGVISYDAAKGKLTIPYTYDPSLYGGTKVEVSVSSTCSNTIKLYVVASSEEVIGSEARIFAKGMDVATATALYSGTLEEMLAQANTMDDEPMLQLTQNKAITEPLVFHKSMTFDIYGKELTATCVSAFVVDAEGVDVTVKDGSYSKTGIISVSADNANPVSVVTFSAAAKLTLEGGTLSATNTNGAAYGIDVKNGSVFYQKGGNLTVVSPSDARGVNVTSASDYATVNGGIITVEASTLAYGIYTKGQSNVTNSEISVSTTTGIKAYGLYVNGGVTTCNNVVTTVEAKTSQAYGAWVNAGRLNYSAGSMTVSAPTSEAVGVNVEHNAIATIQLRSALAVTTGGATARGVNNLGTATILNADVNVIAASDAVAVNIATNALSTTIENGLYKATANSNVYGVLHQNGNLSIDGATVNGLAKTGDNAFGVSSSENATIVNATITAEAEMENAAYGFLNANAGKTYVFKNTSFTAKAYKATSYAIKTASSVGAVDCKMYATSLGGKTACGFYSLGGNHELKNCKDTVRAAYTEAYAINLGAGEVDVTGGSYSATVEQKTATAEENAEVYGFKNAASTQATLEGVTLYAEALEQSFSQNVYGIHVGGTVNCTRCNISAYSAQKNAYGVYATGLVELWADTISGETRANGARALYSNGKFTIDGGVLDATATTTDAYTMLFGGSANGTVLDGRFAAAATSTYAAISTGGTAGKVILKGGYYKSASNLSKYLAAGYSVYHLASASSLYAEGYRYQVIDHNPTTSVCQIVGGSEYTTLEAAMQYAVDNSSVNCVIVMTQPYTLPAGDYHLPKNASLIVPYKSGQTSVHTSVETVSTLGELQENIRLTLAQGVNLMVDGNIEVSAELRAPNDAAITSYVKGPYGRIHMEMESNIVLASTARLYAWGYITGSGSIKALNGAEVREIFQVTDMKTMGQMYSPMNGNSQKVFPLNQYYIQNIEVPVTYYHGSKLYATFKCYYNKDWYGDNSVKLIGSDALFRVTSTNDDAWVRKSYDAVNDKQVWEVNSSATIGSMNINLGYMGVSFNSASYVLPLTNNMVIHVLDGSLGITQNTQLQPGSQIEIDKTAEFNIPSGSTLFVVDNAQWGNYGGGKPAKVVQFSPSWKNGVCPRSSDLSKQNDAAVNVHGKINVTGNLRTTAGGANIYSKNEDAGTINFISAASSSDADLYFANGTTFTSAIKCSSAQLKNGAGITPSYQETAGTTKDHSFVYIDNTWTETYTDGCFKVIGTTYYANPSEYVALKNGKTENSNHTYTTVEDKLLILMDDCQWWEVSATDDNNIFYCAKEGYEGYYEYVGTKWQLVKRKVIFYSDEAGTKELKTIVTNWNGVPDQSVIATNPSKATTAAATYTFYGWKSSVTETEYPWTATLEAAENDMFYTPVFTEKARNYTITFNDADNNGAVKVEAAYGSHPQVAPSKPATAQYTYVFQDFTDGSGTHYATCDELPTVTGAATYTANWTGITNVYTVIFKDGEQTLQTKIDQPYGAATSFAGLTPTKEADDEFEYAFDGWVSSQNGTKYAGTTPTVSGDVTYTAHYATTARYFITFANYDGTVLQKEATTAGVQPVYNGTPRRDADRDGYFRFDGWMDGEGVVYAAGAKLPAVSKKQTYTAQWTYVTTRFTVAFENFDGNGGHWDAQFGEGETPSYDGATPLAKVSDKPAQYYYEFAGWTPAIAPVTGPATYTAQWSEPIPVKYTITFVYDGYGNSIKKEYAYGANPSYDTSAGDPTPRKDDEGEYSFTFNGWDKAFATVTGDATYTAQFLQTQHQYTITFVLDNGSANVEEKYYKGATPSIKDPAKATTAEWSYTFAGWNPAIGPVLYDVTYTAQWNQTGVPYNVTFVDEDGSTVLKATEAVAHGTKPTAPANPSKAYDGVNFYSFAGWVSSVDGNTYTTAASIPAVGTSDVTYKAKYQVVSGVKAAVTTAGGVTTPYTDFATALTAAKASAGSTLKLYANVSAYNQTINVAMTIDFNGHTISGSTNNDITIFTISGNPVVLKDEIGNGGLSATCTTYNKKAEAISVNSGANVTINGGTYYAYNSSTDTRTSRAKTAYAITNNGSLTINNGSFEAQGNTSTGSTIRTINNAQAVTINGGKFAQTGKAASGGNLTTTNSKATLKGGYYTQDLRSANAIMATGYECVSSSEDSDYKYKVQLKKYTLTWNLNGGEITTAGTAAGSVAYTTELVAPVVEKTGYAFNGWTPEVPATMPADNATYTAQWKVNQYTVSWDANGGALSGEYTKGSVDYGTTIEAPTAKKDGYNFAGWSPEVPSTVTDNLSFTAIWTEVPLTADIVADDEVVEINENTKVNNLTISENGSVTIDDAAAVTVVSNLYLEATPDDNLGAVLNGNVQVQGDAFIDINMNGSGTMNKNYYYSFAVPFNVDLNGGVFRMENGNAVPAKPNTEFRVWTYSEAKRAEGRSNATWTLITSGTLVPGVFYLLQVATNNTNTYRFKWNHSGRLNNRGNISVSQTGTDSENSGWQGVANNGLGYSLMTKENDEAYVVQALNSEGNCFDVLNKEGKATVALGNPVFIQTGSTIKLTATSAPSTSAPGRVPAQTNSTGVMNLQITMEGESKHADQIFFSASDEALDEYEIGKDVAKMFMGTAKKAQLWIKAYGQRLVANEAVMSNNRADFALTMFAPAAADYELNLRDLPSDAQVVLLYNGAPVADLTLMPYYSLSLTQGETTDYSIAIIRKTPSVTTGTEQMEKTQTEVQKIFFDGKLYIVSGERVYDAQGKLVK